MEEIGLRFMYYKKSVGERYRRLKQQKTSKTNKQLATILPLDYLNSKFQGIQSEIIIQFYLDQHGFFFNISGFV